MTYPSQNFYPAFETISRSGGFDRVVTGFAEAVAERVKSAIGGSIANYAYWRRVRATTRQLSMLDDKMLKDIGLHRSQITEAARRVAAVDRAAR